MNRDINDIANSLVIKSVGCVAHLVDIFWTRSSLQLVHASVALSDEVMSSVFVPVVTLHLDDAVVVPVTQRAYRHGERTPRRVQRHLDHLRFVHHGEPAATH